MESLRSWVLLLSGTALLTAAIGALAPPGAKQAFRVLCAVALLYTALLPLRGVSFSRLELDNWLQPQVQAQEALNLRAQDAAVLASQRLLRQEIETALHEAGQALSVDVRCARFEDGIAPTEITLRGSADKKSVEEVLQPFLTVHTRWMLLTEDTDDD